MVMISIRTMHMCLIACTIEFAAAMLHPGMIAGAEPFRLMMKNRIPENPQRVCFEGTRVVFYGERITFGGKLLKNRDAAEIGHSKLFRFAVGLLRFFELAWVPKAIKDPLLQGGSIRGGGHT